MDLDPHQLIIDIASQSLYHYKGAVLYRTYQISTALKGAGEKKGSEQTPRGWHIIRAKIGNHEPLNTIFIGRRPTGLYSAELALQYPNRDWILCRILWLSGLEKGKNRLGNCDTMQRFIYIHGCPDTKPMRIPLSKGCIRMRNAELAELFDEVPLGTKVLIQE